MPLVGLDEVIGILLVRSSVTEYSEEHLRALSVIAANLAAYITIRGAGASCRARQRARRGPPCRRRARAAKDKVLERVSADLKVPLLPAGDRADELEQKILAQAQRLDDLLGQARLASTELRLTLRAAEPALLDEDPSSPGSGRRRGQLG